MNLKDQLIAVKNLTEVKVGDITFYIKKFTVADLNAFREQSHELTIKLAKEQKIDLDLDNEELFIEQSEKVKNPYVSALGYAFAIRDKDGNRIFDPSSIDDLKAINDLDASVISAANTETAIKN